LKAAAPATELCSRVRLSDWSTYAVYQVYLPQQGQLPAASINTSVSAIEFLEMTLEAPWGKDRLVRMERSRMALLIRG